MKKNILLTIAIISTFVIYAQQENRVITTGVPFLMIASDARAAGMGEMGVATPSDVYSQHWNPAKYPFSKRESGLGVSYTPYLSNLVNDIFLGNLTYYKTLSDRGAWSASIRYFSLGEIEFGQTIYDFINPIIKRPNEFVLDAAYSLKLSDYFSMAVSGAFVTSDLKLDDDVDDASSASTVAVGVSGYYQSDEIPYNAYSGIWRAGFNISNMGPKLSYDEDSTSDYLPTNLRLGGGFDFIFDSYNKLSVSLEVNKLLVPSPSEEVLNANGELVGYRQPDVSFISGMFKSFNDAPDGFSEELKEFTWAIGAEFNYDDSFSLRAGYFNESESKGARKFLTLGAGFRYNVIDIDLSYLISATKVVNPLENTLRFSLTFNFGDERYY